MGSFGAMSKIGSYIDKLNISDLSSSLAMSSYFMVLLEIQALHNPLV